MMIKYNILFVVAGFTLLLLSCSKDSSDYRETFVGTYECTKSTISFEDENFRTDIDDIVIEIPADTDSLISLDGTHLLIQADGTTGRLSVDGHAYNLVFDGSSFRMSTLPIVPGLAATCYILGERK